MLDKALGIGSPSQQFFFQTLLKSIVFTSQNYVKQLPQDTTFYITLIKGMAKIDQLKTWINAQISDNTITLDNLPLHFHVVNFNPRRPTQFTFKLYHKTQSTDAEQIGSFPFIPTKYINQFKNNNKKEFIQQFAFNGDIKLNFELFIDKSRFALNKIVREKTLGENANQDENDRARERRRSFRGRANGDDASSMSSQSRRRLMRTGKRSRSKSISRKNKDEEESQIQKDNKFIKNLQFPQINFVETANLTESAGLNRDIDNRWKHKDIGSSEHIQKYDFTGPQKLIKIEEKNLTMSQILGSQAQSVQQTKKPPQGLKRDVSSRSLIKRTGSITIKNQQQFQKQKEKLAHQVPYQSIRPTSVLRQSRNKMYEDVQLELQKQKQHKKHFKNKLIMIAFMLVCVFFIYLAMQPSKKHRSKRRKY